MFQTATPPASQPFSPPTSLFSQPFAFQTGCINPPLDPPPIDPDKASEMFKKSRMDIARSEIYSPSGFVFKVCISLLSFSHSDASIQAGDVFFRLPTLWMISKSSALFGGIVGLTDGGCGMNGNGSSEDDPIVLDVSAKDFEAYCNWQYVLKYVIPPSIHHRTDALRLDFHYSQGTGLAFLPSH